MTTYHREVLLSKSEIINIQIALNIYARQLSGDSETYKSIMKLSDELDNDLDHFCIDCGCAEELNCDNRCYTCEVAVSGKVDE